MQPDLTAIIVAAAEISRVSVEQIRSQSRTRQMRDARAVVVALARKSGYSYLEIGKVIGRDHSACINLAIDHGGRIGSDLAFTRFYNAVRIQANMVAVRARKPLPPGSTARRGKPSRAASAVTAGVTAAHGGEPPAGGTGTKPLAKPGDARALVLRGGKWVLVHVDGRASA